MKKFVKLLAFSCSAVLAATSFATFAACGNEKAVIGIMQYGSHESLNNCYEGVMQGLTAAGIDTKDYKIELVNDNFDGDTANSHATAFVNKGAKVIVGIATPSAMAAANQANGEVPVVYCAVTDGAVMSGYNNVCGSSDRPNFEKQLEVVTSFLGKSDVNIGVISHTGESSDAVQIEELNEAAKKYDGMKTTVKYITEISTITTVVDSLINENVDCFINLLDNTVVGQLQTILARTNEAGIPVFGSEVEQVVKGCLASASIDYIEIGKIAGEMAGQIVLGQKQASDLGCKVISNPTLYYNKNVAETLKVTIPTDLEGLISTEQYSK